MEENMMLIVSDETHDMTTADSVRPSSENTHTTVRSGEMVATGVIGRVPGADICSAANLRRSPQPF